MQQYEEEQLRTEEATRTRVTVEEVLMLLNECQCHRKALARLNAKLQDWRDGSPDLDKEYRAFEQAGGVTEFDFADFMDGTFRYRRTRQKRHLRLVSNNRYRVRQKLPDPRDDAA
jgi:hypothetical protein